MSFAKPRLPSSNRDALPSNSNRGDLAPITIDDVVEKYSKNQKRVCRLMGLSDATGSMWSLWRTTREHITSMIDRLENLGTDGFQVNWVAYRDYSEGDQVLEASGWTNDADTIRKFIARIKCYGGDDRDEAVEHALKYAVDDEHATRVVLIGDAPPHLQGDYIKQATQLAASNRPVFTFVVGDDPDTIRTFEEISRITGGIASRIKKQSDLLDMVELIIVDEVRGAKGLAAHLNTDAARRSTEVMRFAEELRALGEGPSDD